MKILMIFIDMLRAVNQNVSNSKAPHNRLDDALEKFGGIVFSNCYSPAPDTPRGLASIWTGSYPKINGCDQRIKYPRFFLNDNLDNLWKLFKRTNLELNLFMPKVCLELGEMPKNFDFEKTTLFDDNDLINFCDSVQIKDNSVTYVTLNDYHAIIDDTRAKLSGLAHLYDVVGREVDLIYSKLIENNFDIVVIFSDHGCLLEGDAGGLGSRGRIKTYLQIWVKNIGVDKIIRDDRLCSCMDLFPTMAYLLNGFVLNRTDGLNLFKTSGHDFLILEDYLNFSATLIQVLGWYAVILPDYFIQTDCTDNWYLNYRSVILQPELKEQFKTILSNYATDYAENSFTQKAIDAHRELDERVMNLRRVQRPYYSNGEERIYFSL